MIGCLFSAELDEKLTAKERKDVLAQVKKTKGVFSAAFDKAAKPTIAIHAGLAEVQKEIEKIPGVKKIIPDRHMRM